MNIRSSLIIAAMFLLVLGVVVYALWYWMQTPKFIESFEQVPQLTEEQKIKTLQDLTKESSEGVHISTEEKVKTLEALRASNETGANVMPQSADTSGSSQSSSVSEEDKLKTLQSLHGAQ